MILIHSYCEITSSTYDKMKIPLFWKKKFAPQFSLTLDDYMDYIFMDL